MTRLRLHPYLNISLIFYNKLHTYTMYILILMNLVLCTYLRYHQYNQSTKSIHQFQKCPCVLLWWFTLIWVGLSSMRATLLEADTRGQVHWRVYEVRRERIQGHIMQVGVEFHSFYPGFFINVQRHANYFLIIHFPTLWFLHSLLKVLCTFLLS